MDFLQDQKAFEVWKKENIFGVDICDTPKSFPCWVYKQVVDWGAEIEKAEYLYQDDLEGMLSMIFRHLDG